MAVHVRRIQVPIQGCPRTASQDGANQEMLQLKRPKESGAAQEMVRLLGQLGWR